MTSWYGHRDDRDIPEAVRTVWREKFRRPPGGPRQSNVDLAVLDTNGTVVHHFDGFARPRPEPPQRGREIARRSPRPEGLAAYTARQLQRSVRRLAPAERRRVRGSWKTANIRLPDLGPGEANDTPAGVRVFVQLIDDRMRAYQAPVVEVVPLGSDDAQALTYPTQARNIDARKFEKWLSQIYPPGVMERTNPRTKKVYEIQSTEGTLRFCPAGSDGTRRYAVLEGEIRLTDEGEDGFSYRGQLQVVVGYRAGQTLPDSLRGIFDGTYPRTDRRRDRTRTLPLRAAIESLPRQ